LSLGMIARATFNRCTFAAAEEDDEERSAGRASPTSAIVLRRAYFIVADCSLVSASLHPARRFFVPPLVFEEAPHCCWILRKILRSSSEIFHDRGASSCRFMMR